MGWIFAPSSPRRVKLKESKEQIYKIKEAYPKIRHVAVFAENSFGDILKVAKEGLFDYLQVAAEADWLKDLRILLKKKKSKTNRILPAVRVQASLDSNDLLKYENEFLFILDSFVAGQPGAQEKVLILLLSQVCARPIS